MCYYREGRERSGKIIAEEKGSEKYFEIHIKIVLRFVSIAEKAWIFMSLTIQNLLFYRTKLNGTPETEQVS